MVSFFTHGWIQNSIRSFGKYFPDMKILVVDNNPHYKEQCSEWNWSNNIKTKWNAYFNFCLAEREWLKNQSNVILLDKEITTKQTTHGKCMDIALEWCKNNNKENMLCVEPDNSFSGNAWFHYLSDFLADDKHMVGIKFSDELSNHIHPCPILLKVNEIKWSFNGRHIGKQYFDCFQWVFHKLRERGKAELIVENFEGSQGLGFKHYWSGSYNNFVSNNRNCPMVTFM